MDKRANRNRRAKRTRMRIRASGTHRLCIHRTPKHIYAQIIDPTAGSTVASASTVDKSLRVEIGYGGNVEAAKVVGKAIAERAKGAGVTSVAFDRAGFRYHGRVKALADAARESGLQF